MRRLGRALALLRGEEGRVALGALTLALSVGASLLVPRQLAAFVDALTSQGAGGGRAVSAVVGLLAAQGLAMGANGYLTASAGARLVARVRRRLYSALLRQPIAFFDRHQVGELTTRLSSDVEELQSALSNDAVVLVQSALSAVGYAVMLVLVSPTLAAVVLACVPLAAWLSLRVGQGMRRLARLRQRAVGRAGRLAQEGLSNVRQVRAFGRMAEEGRRYDAATADALRVTLVAQRLFAVLSTGAHFAGLVTLLAVLVVGGRLVAAQALSVGDLLSVLLYAELTSGALTSASSLWGRFMRAVGAADRVLDLLAQFDAQPPRGGQVLTHLEGAVEFQGVTFHYPSRPQAPALTDFSLTLAPGDRVALVGHSGSGKSTVASLLLGFYEADEGVLRFDGHDARTLDRASVAAHLAVVEQEPVLFSGSILENIALGAPGATEEDARRAARLASVDEFVARLPQGYRTQVGPRGVQLSGGQKQRIAIARAVLKDPRILILDEATSALDVDSERQVQAALAGLMRGRTTLIIAHRLSTVVDAQRVLVLDHGRVVQQGPHQQLLADRGGAYFALVTGQLLGPAVGTSA